MTSDQISEKVHPLLSGVKNSCPVISPSATVSGNRRLHCEIRSKTELYANIRTLKCFFFRVQVKFHIFQYIILMASSVYSNPSKCMHAFFFLKVSFLNFKTTSNVRPHFKFNKKKKKKQRKVKFFECHFTLP